MNVLIQGLSLVGAGLILLGYYLLQRGTWKANGPAYLWANVVGAAALTVVAVYDRRFGFIVLESAWVAISAWGLIGRSRPRAHSTI